MTRTDMPTACYRLQFREGMDFDRAAGLVPYLSGLGISHLYASPLFTAAPGSTHGYDVTDPTQIDPSLGGREGLERLSAALKGHGMGLILDIVPNHMAFGPDTPWLRDVLRHGQDSRYAGHFDIDWEAPALRLPWLADPFETMLERDAFAVEDADEGPVLVVDGGLRVPLAAGPALEAARDRPSFGTLRALHAAQAWRLTHWQSESDAISHRRFFNVTSLVGVRVEDPQVFDDVHALLFDLVQSGTVDGVRIDHIDGLADPAGYLARLTGQLGDVPVWVEKILSGDETLPDWPVAGTTGYVAARAFARVVTNRGGLQKVDALYRDRTGATRQFRDVLEKAKQQILTHDLSAELWALHGQVSNIAANDPVGAEFGPETLRRAIIDFIIAFPRYRTYMTADHVAPEDAQLIEDTAAQAAERSDSPQAIAFLARILTASGPKAARLRIRFQQVTGAAIAKSQEDTAFYRDTRLLSANEVGGEPDEATLSPTAFHGEMQRRLQQMPQGLTLTSSHDTKRSEDARMRIAAITHAPAAFAEFHAACAAEAGPEVGADLVWYLAQTLLAMHPASAETDDPRADLERRLTGHVEKALREAKRVTFWAAPDAAVEDAARAYAGRLAERFTTLPDLVTPIVERGAALSLVQVALKLTVPGIPDIYQGCEMGSYLLTDPDNRAPVDFDRLQGLLDGSDTACSAFDRRKFDLTHCLLSLRQSHPALFAEGAYEPLSAPHGGLAYQRIYGGLTLSVSLSLTDAPAPSPKGDRVVWSSDEGPIAVALSGG